MREDTAKQPVRGDVILKALDNLDFMGLNMKDTLIAYFLRHSIVLDSEHFYTLDQIEIEIKTLFGEGATRLLMHQIRTGINAQFQ